MTMPTETVFVLQADIAAAHRIAEKMAANAPRGAEPSHTSVLSMATIEGMKLYKAVWEKPDPAQS
jgi:hypothetical protein